MTVGTTGYGGHGYDVDEDEGGSLTDDDFEYGLTATTYTTYVVEAVLVDADFGVSFLVDIDPAGVPLDNTLTLEIGGHEFPVEDRNAFSSSTFLYWAVPAALDDLETEFPVGSTATVCLRTAAQVCPSGSIVTPTTDPVWSTTMTAGDTPAGHGYDRTDLDAPTIGALDDDNFDYGSSSYGVLAIDVATNAVRFVVAESGLPTNEILTLELGGHALAFSDRHNAISGQSRWYWTVPAALDDLETEFPVGSTATVCLRTATQVCPTGSIVTPPVTPPPNPTLSVGDAAGTEGGDVTFTATLSATATADVMATWTASIESGDTAVLADLGTTTTGPVMVTAGQTTGTFMVPTAPDATNEGNETFTVTLSSVSSNAQLAADATATGTIVNDDQPTVGFKEESVIVLEGAAIISFLVELDEASTVPITVDWETRAGSAEADVDYTAASGQVTFPAEETEQTITITVLDDAADEDREDFKVRLSNATAQRIDLPADPARVLIEDNDDPPTVTVADGTATEGDKVEFTVTLSALSGLDVEVDYATTETDPQSAVSGTDFTAASGTLEIEAGNRTGTIEVQTTEDDASESAETFTLTISNPDNATLGAKVAATGTINDDANAAPTFSSSSTFDAAENQTAAGTVLATDGDTGDDITGYEITGGADRNFFSIGATSGELTFDAAPNFEDAQDQGTNNTYVVEVEATSGTGTREKTATQTITVTVTDVGGEAPGKPAAPDVAAASVSSLTVNWSAPDNGGPAIDDYDVRYRAGTGGSWSDGNHTGTATTATLSSLSENTSYQVQVRATNDEGTGSWSDSGTGTTDANAAPTFSSSATFDAAENQTSAGTVLATDGDTGDDITGGADQAFFSIGATSGALKFDAAPNFEDAKDSDNDNDYVVTVQATSGTGTREKTATQTITVTVTDVAGEAPGKPDAPDVAAASVSSLTVSWSAPANAGPAIDDYDVQYRTKSPVGDWTVVADTTSTALSATLSGLDEGTEYDVQVRAANADGESDWSASGSGATDANPAGVTVSATALTVTEQDTTGDSYTVVLDTEPTHEVTVTVGGHAGTDVSPSASTLIFTTSNWDQAQTVTVTALNDDDTANDAVTLTHTATSTDGNYSGITIAGVSVTVTDNDTTTPAVTLALSADSIGENGGVSTVTATVSPASAAAFTVTVAAANRTLTLEDDDAAPVMTLEVNPAVIAEAAGSSTVTVRITNGVTFAEDQEIRLSFSGTAEKDTDYRVESERLNLMAGDGSVTTPVTSVDDELVDVDETILITATHDRNAVGTQQTITITDDDAAPVVTTTSPLLVEENETAVATLMATDTDDRLEDLEWEIAGGTDRSKFTLTAGGELAFKVAKDYENPDDANRDGDYEITVRVSDGANRAEADFIVRLQDVDDIAPVFSSAVADGSTLTLAYSEALDSSSVPGTDAFTVTGGNATRTVSGVRVIGSAVELTLDPAVEHGQTGIRVSYTVPTGTGATPIQDTAGNDADSFNNRQVSNNTGDTTGPAVETVSITSNAGSDATYAAGETIQATVTFDETVVVTRTPRLTLKVGGRDRTADYQSVTGGAVRFEYQVVAGDSDPDGVSIEANRLSRGEGTIRDGSQNDAVLEHDALADNTQHKVDGVAPVLVDPDGAVVNGATLTLTYDEALNGSSRPATSAYTVSGGSETRTVTRVRVSGSAVMLTLVPAVEHGETDLRVSYRPGANPIRDLVGNEAGVLMGQEVDNRTPDTTAPSIEGIELSSDPGNDETYAAGEVIAVRVRYSETVRVDTTGGTPTLNLTVGNRSKTAGARSGLESTEVVFVYEVERGEVDEDGVSIARGRISLNGGTIRDDGNNNAALSHDGLTADSGHRVDGVEPKLQSATVHASRLALSYDEALDEASTSTPAALDFTVTVAGNDRPVIQVQVSGNAVMLRLSSPVTAGETVTVSYRPGFNPVRDQVGNAVEALTDEPALPPLITIAATAGGTSVTEGTAVQFTLTRELPTAAALTVGLSVTERGEVIETAGSYEPPEEVTFTVGDTTATLTVLTEDDEQQESGGAVIATLQPGAGYRLGGASTQSAQVTVEDDEGGAPPGPIGPGLPPVPNPVPSAPRNLEALGGDEQVTLSWEAPEDDGGFPITDYEYLISGTGGGWISTGSTETTHTVTELTNGRLYVLQVRAVSGVGAGASSHQVEVTPGVGRLEFAHFANGLSITSDLVLVNVFARPIRPWLYFYNREGERIAVESVVEVTEELEVAEDGSLTVQTEMQPLEALTISTHGQGEVVAGSVTVLSNGPIGGVLRFDLPGVGVAGVGAGQAVRDALFPARRQAGAISTAAAIRNLQEEELVVTCQLMQEGAVLEEVEIELEANGQDGRFIEEVFTTTDTTDFVGLVRCTAPAGKLFVGVAVELDAGNGIFTTLPVLPVDRTVFRGGEYTLDFAHFANGASITSDLVLVNVSIRPSRPAGPFTTPIPPTRPSFYFYDRAGERLAAQSVVAVAGDLELAEDGSLAVQTEMQPLQAVTISTHGRGEVVAGSVRVVAEGPIGGVLRFDLPGVGVAGVGAGQPLTDALFPARRQAGGISTAAAIRNLEAEELVVSCRLMQEGAVLEEVDIELQANGQDGRFIEEVFTRTDTSDFVGLVRCTAEGEFTGVAVELDAGAGIFTTLPVVPVPERMSQQ